VLSGIVCGVVAFYLLGMTDFVLPSHCSVRRAVVLSGLGKSKCETLFATDPHGNRAIPLAALEKLTGRKITEDDWRTSTLKIARELP
jgi:hypothetical protein